MKQEEQDLLKAAKRIGAKGELEIEKAQYMLSSAQRMLTAEKEENPELYEILRLFRVWTEIRDARRQLETAQDLTSELRAVIAYLERNRSAVPPNTETYPALQGMFREVAEKSGTAFFPEPAGDKLLHKG